EAFVRVGHGIVVFPGGVGTAEEILYLLGVLLHPENRSMPFPLVMTGPGTAAPYFRRIDEFVASTLGPDAQQRYKIIVDDPVEVARTINRGLRDVLAFRKEHGDAYYFNWRLKILDEFQRPFVANHESMRQLNIDESLDPYELAANLRRAFSGIVSGNVREDTAELIDRDGPFEIRGTRRIMGLLDDMLAGFVAQHRMKISRDVYDPCYVIK
ncbi:MAG: DUF3412 domain-containing protein, partial [Planctomycetes bacterium]|nr:DUF3412 domain-containing protein [Planctomycetota bacterium]